LIEFIVLFKLIVWTKVIKTVPERTGKKSLKPEKYPTVCVCFFFLWPKRQKQTGLAPFFYFLYSFEDKDCIFYTVQKDEERI
jgi:hypothetical protein